MLVETLELATSWKKLKNLIREANTKSQTFVTMIQIARYLKITLN
jgi:hypothetical protein